MATDDSISQLIDDWRNGDQEAFDQLFPLVYDDLKRIAHRHLERGDRSAADTINTTGLVHELYLNLVDQTRATWRDRAHFFAVASKAMRHILIDFARHKSAGKRGGKRIRIPLADAHASVPARDTDLLALDQALTALAERDARLGQVVECRFFGGMTVEETAEALGVGERTVARDWTRAKAYLVTALSP